MNDKYIDQELRNSLAEQSFLGLFHLNPLDVDTDLDQPMPYASVVSLNKYPGFYFDSIHKHFIRYHKNMKATQIWLEYNGKPIQWHLPFCTQIQANNEEVDIKVNYRRRPETIIAMYDSLQSELKNRYFWTLKQACMIRYKHKWDRQIFQILTIEQQHNMFQQYMDSTLTGDFYAKFDKIWDLNLLKKDTQISIPLRVIVHNNMIQVPYVLKDTQATIENVIESLLPGVLDPTTVKISVQGLVVPATLLAQSLLLSLYMPDGFTYIVICDN